MCGRFTFIMNINTLENSFAIANLAEFALKNLYNIATSQDVLAIINDRNRNKAGFLRSRLDRLFTDVTVLKNLLELYLSKNMDAYSVFKADFLLFYMHNMF
jgi:catalase (peroxidase I)